MASSRSGETLAITGVVFFFWTAAVAAADEPRAFDCLLEPRAKIKLATPVAGVLSEVPVDRGDAIRKGQVLARLDSRVEKALLDLARARAENDASIKAKEAQIVFLQKKRERAVELQAKGAGTAATLDEADANYRVAAEELREAESNRRIAELDQERAQQVLNQRAILSPVDGVVAERNLVGGEYAYEQAPIMTVAQTDPLNVEVFVPISLYGSVHAGMEAAIIPQEPIGGAYKARVEVIDPLVDSRSGTFGIRLVLPNPQGKIPAGLRCKVEFPVVN